MKPTKEEIKGTRILNEYASSNIFATEYDTKTSELLVTFKGGRKYQYHNVPHNLFTKFRMSESQGKFFNREISKKYRYNEIKK
mgnify:FL=1